MRKHIEAKDRNTSPSPSWPDLLPSPRVPVALHGADLGFVAAPSLPLPVTLSHANSSAPCSSPCAWQDSRPRAAPPAPAVAESGRPLQLLRAAGSGCSIPSRANPAPRNVAPLGCPFSVNHHGRTVNHHGRTKVYFHQFLRYVFMRWKKRLLPNFFISCCDL